MARMARTVFEGVPHHITQRGNRRQQVFFCDDDYLIYLNLISTYCHLGKVDIWAYWLMLRRNGDGLVRAHLKQEDAGIMTVKPMLDRIEDWAGYLSDDGGEASD